MALAAKNKLLAGYRFRPTEEELINILDSKTKQNQLHPYYPIVERSLFGENPPWQVLNDTDPWEYTFEGKSTKKTIFVFSKLVGLGKTRVARTTACGTWHEKSKTTKIKNSAGVVIGHMKYYMFKNGSETTATNNSKWMMHEYSFPNYKSGYVLCKITFLDDSYDMSTESAISTRILNSFLFNETTNIMAARNELPMEYRFRPTDQELLSFLDYKTKQNQLYPIVERSLFGENPPWYVLNDTDPWEYSFDGKSTKKTIFVLSKLVGLGKNRAVRTSEWGTWQEKAKTNKIKNSDDVVIGRMKYYTFNAAAKNGSETTNNRKWMMHEYSFPDYKSGYVLCKITALDDSCDMSIKSDDVLLGKRKSSTSLDDGGSHKVCKGNGSWSGQETVMAELEQVYDFTYDPLAGYNNDRMREVPGYARGMQGQQIEYYNGLENAAFVTSYDCSFPTTPTTQQTESQQVKENLDRGTYDDLLKESYSASSVGYYMSTTCGAGGTSTSIDQLQGKGEQLTVLDDGISKGCEGSGSENERVTVTAQSDETGADNDSPDWLACIDFGDDRMFPLMFPDESEFPRYSEEVLVPDNFGLEDFDFGTSNDHVAAFELFDSRPAVQQTEIQQVKEMSAGGTRDYMTRSGLDEAEKQLLRCTHKRDNALTFLSYCTAN